MCKRYVSEQPRQARQGGHGPRALAQGRRGRRAPRRREDEPAQLPPRRNTTAKINDMYRRLGVETEES